MAKRIETIKNEFNRIENILDWDIKSKNNIAHTLRTLSNELDQLTTRTWNLGQFIHESKNAYAEAERHLNSRLSTLDNLWSSSVKSPVTEPYANDFRDTNGRDTIDRIYRATVSSRIDHILSLFIRIGQKITNHFLPTIFIENALKTADTFLTEKPCITTGFIAPFKTMTLPTSYIGYNPNNLIPISSNTLQLSVQGSFLSTSGWSNIWQHVEDFSARIHTTFEDIKVLSHQHQEILLVLPKEIEALNRQSWARDLYKLPSAKERYYYAMHQMDETKEAAHAMLLSWMSTHPESRGIDTKYYPQLLAWLMVTNNKEELTLEQIDKQYLKIYNHNEASIKKAQEKEKENQDKVNAFLETALEWTHTILDIVGWIPLCGDTCDLINAAIYVMESDYVNAALSCIAFIPAVGSALKGVLGKLFKAGNDAGAIGKVIKKLTDLFGDAKTIVKKLSNVADGMVKWVSNLADTLRKKLKSSFIYDMLGQAKHKIDSIIDAVVSKVKGITSKIKDTIDSVIKKVTDALSPKKVAVTPEGIDINDVVDTGKVDTPNVLRTEVQDNYDNVMDEFGENAGDAIKKGTSRLTERVRGYLNNIIIDGGLDATKLNDIKLALQKGVFDAEEIKQISKYMRDNGVTEAYEAAMKKVDFGKYLRTIAGEPPIDMVKPHAHHILFKTGLGEAQQKLVKEGQEILHKHGIDPIVGAENLVWAPNGVTGQHSFSAIEHVVNQLKAVDAAGGDYDDIVEMLEELGHIASRR